MPWNTNQILLFLCFPFSFPIYLLLSYLYLSICLSVSPFLLTLTPFLNLYLRMIHCVHVYVRESVCQSLVCLYDLLPFYVSTHLSLCVYFLSLSLSLSLLSLSLSLCIYIYIIYIVYLSFTSTLPSLAYARSPFLHYP